jgi:hypothetical protein
MLDPPPTCLDDDYARELWRRLRPHVRTEDGGLLAIYCMTAAKVRTGAATQRDLSAVHELQLMLRVGPSAQEWSALAADVSMMIATGNRRDVTALH